MFLAKSLKKLDNLLRGEVEPGEETELIGEWLFWLVVCAGIYGLAMGMFSLLSRTGLEVRYMLANFFKVPLLLGGTFVITFPSLYVFLALQKIELRFREFLGVALAGHTIFAVILCSLAPVLAFFSITSQAYAFIVLLNIVIFAIGGIIGLRILEAKLSTALPGEGIGGVADLVTSLWRGGARLVWYFIYILVGTELSWILRPFVGDPNSPFVIFRGRAGAFSEAFLNVLGQYFFG